MKTKILIGTLLALGLLLAIDLAGVRAQETEESPPAEVVAEVVAEVAPAEPQSEPESEPEVRLERRSGDQVSVFGGEIHVPAHVERWGDVVSVGGDVIIEGRVRGNVVVVGGSLELTGRVDENVVGVLSTLETRNAEIGEQLINVAGTLDEESTSVGDQKVNIGIGDGWLTLAKPFGVLGAVLFWGRLVRLLAIFVLVLLLVALVPERIRRISEETPQRIVAAFFVGLLGYLAYWIVLVLALATVVGVVVAWLLFIVLKWLAIVGMFHFLGHRVGRGFGREMSLLGAVLLGFAPYVLITLLPSAFGIPGLIVAALFGFFVWVFLEIPAVGLVILTRAGGQRRIAPPAAPAAQPEQTATPPAIPVVTPPLENDVTPDAGPVEDPPEPGAERE